MIPTQHNCLPSRLLDVKSSAGSSNLIFLVDGNGRSGQYTALSHRWSSGLIPNWVTTIANRKRRERGLDVGILPSCIRDAITITQQLGIQYLWVDSLCIVQDSKDDWAVESVKMLEVFGNASITLFADSAKNDEDNILKARQGGNFQSRRGISLNVIGKFGAEVPVRVLQRYSRYRSHYPAKAADFFRSDVVHSTLSQRGWIFQEQCVANRRLHFGDHQMYWICRESATAEDGSNISFALTPWLQLGLNRSLPAAQNDELWGHMVENYTRRSLTKSEDRMLALSGLAKLFSELIDDRYIIGCWEKMLRFNMLWAASPVNSRHSLFYSSNLKSRRPLPVSSWSWLSVVGPVEYPYLKAVNSLVCPDFTLLRGPQCTYQGNEYATAPSSCTPIRLRGTIERAIAGRPITLKPGPVSSPPWYRDSIDLQGSCVPLSDSTKGFIGMMIPDSTRKLTGLKVLLLSAWVSTGMCPSCGKTKPKYRHFVVLEPLRLRTAGHNPCRRIGYGWAYLRERSGSARENRYPDHDLNDSYYKRWCAQPEEVDIF